MNFFHKKDLFSIGLYLGKYVENAIPDRADPLLQALELVAADYSPVQAYQRPTL